jgi:hypothetical protein
MTAYKSESHVCSEAPHEISNIYRIEVTEFDYRLYRRFQTIVTKLIFVSVLIKYGTFLIKRYYAFHFVNTTHALSQKDNQRNARRFSKIHKFYHNVSYENYLQK